MEQWFRGSRQSSTRLFLTSRPLETAPGKTRRKNTKYRSASHELSPYFLVVGIAVKDLVGQDV